jgi:hypothetical protein
MDIYDYTARPSKLREPVVHCWHRIIECARVARHILNCVTMLARMQHRDRRRRRYGANHSTRHTIRIDARTTLILCTGRVQCNGKERSSYSSHILARSAWPEGSRVWRRRSFQSGRNIRGYWVSKPRVNVHGCERGGLPCSNWVTTGVVPLAPRRAKYLPEGSHTLGRSFLYDTVT